MAEERVKKPTLPVAPERYNKQDQDQLRGTLERQFSEVDAGIRRAIDGQDLPTQGWTLIERKGIASPVSSVDFTTSIDDTYETYIFELSNVIPATDSVDLWVRTSANAGGAWDSGASAYRYACEGFGTGALTPSDQSTGAAQIVLTPTAVGSASGEEGVSGEIHLIDPSSGVNTTMRGDLIMRNDGNQLIVVDVVGSRESAAAVDGVRFLFSSGDVESGILTLYGITKS